MATAQKLEAICFFWVFYDFYFPLIVRPFRVVCSLPLPLFPPILHPWVHVGQVLEKFTSNVIIVAGILRRLLGIPHWRSYVFPFKFSFWEAWPCWADVSVQQLVMSQSQQRRGTAHGSCIVFTAVYCGHARVSVANEDGWSLQGAETVQEAPECVAPPHTISLQSQVFPLLPPVCQRGLVCLTQPSRSGHHLTVSQVWPGIECKSRDHKWASSFLSSCPHFLFCHLKKSHPGLPASSQLPQGTMCFFSQLSQPEEVARPI